MKQYLHILMCCLCFFLVGCLTSSSKSSLTTNMSDEEIALVLTDLGVCRGFTNLITSGGGPTSRRKEFESCLNLSVSNELYSENKNLHNDYMEGETPYRSLTDVELFAALEQCYCLGNGIAIPILVQNPVRTASGGVRSVNTSPALYDEQNANPGILYDNEKNSPGNIYDIKDGGLFNTYHKEAFIPKKVNDN